MIIEIIKQLSPFCLTKAPWQSGRGAPEAAMIKRTGGNQYEIVAALRDGGASVVIL
jgi:hypothetical protein